MSQVAKKTEEKKAEDTTAKPSGAPSSNVSSEYEAFMKEIEALGAFSSST